MLANVDSILKRLSPPVDDIGLIKQNMIDIKMLSSNNEVRVEEIKAFNILAEMERKVGKPFAKDLAKLFRLQGAEVVTNFRQKSKFMTFEKIHTTVALFSFSKWQKLFEDKGKPYLSEAIKLSGENMADSLGEIWDFDSPEVQAQLGVRATKYSLSVNETTRNKITRILQKGVENNSSIDTIAAELARSFKEMEVFRAIRIARTETVGSTNFGRMSAMKSSARVTKHMWISQRDKDVRETHSVLDGQIVKIGQPFNVPGDYRGDPAWPSDINERCGTIPVDKKPLGEKE